MMPVTHPKRGLFSVSRYQNPGFISLFFISPTSSKVGSFRSNNLMFFAGLSDVM